MCKLHARNSDAFVASLAKKGSNALLQVICVGINLAKLLADRQTKRTHTYSYMYGGNNYCNKRQQLQK